eukprot:5133480-Prymnesium_polylepis.1
MHNLTVRVARSQARLGRRTRPPARPTQAHAWQRLHRTCGSRHRAHSCWSPSPSKPPHPSAHCGRVLTPSVCARAQVQVREPQLRHRPHRHRAADRAAGCGR